MTTLLIHGHGSILHESTKISCRISACPSCKVLALLLQVDACLKRRIWISSRFQKFVHRTKMKDKKGRSLTCQEGSQPWFSTPTGPGVQSGWRDVEELHLLRHHLRHCWTNHCLMTLLLLYQLIKKGESTRYSSKARVNDKYCSKGVG